MQIDVEEGESLYRTLAAAVVPRPIAWVSSRSADGVDNLAPYSFFNVVSTLPPTVMFAPSDRDGEGALKDTPRNVRDTGEFVVNVVTMADAEAMNATSGTLPPGESEFDDAAVERASSATVAPVRVASAPVALECELSKIVDVGRYSMVLGEVVSVHVDDAVATDGQLDVEKLDAVGRLSGSLYATTRDRFSMERPS